MGKKILFISNTDWTLHHHWIQNLTGLRDAGFELTLCSPDGPLVKKLRDAGFRHLAYSLDRKGMNLFTEAATMRQIWKVLDSEKPDLVHALTVKPAIYTSFLLRLIASGNKHYGNVPVLNTYTGLGSLFEEHASLVRYGLRPFLTFAFHHKRIWQSFLNDGNCETFKKLGLVYGDQYFITASEGVDTELFKPLPAKNGRFVVLLAARVLWSKGVAEFVEASDILKNHYPDIEFQLVGEPDFGNPQAIPEHTLKKWEQDGKLRYLGHQDNMPMVFNQAEIVVLPSYHEGAPKVIKEAFATGVPVIASDIPGCRRLVENGETGFLIPVRNGAALANAIKNLYEDSGLRISMGKKARNVAETRLDYSHVVNEWVTWYSKLLK